MTIAAIVVLAVLLAAGLVGFFADPLGLPPQVLDVLDKRASVMSMFIGAAGLIVAVVDLLLQVRADAGQVTSQSAATPAAPGITPPIGSPSREATPESGRRTYGGDHIEFHHNIFSGPVIGKQVAGPRPPTPPTSVDGDGDGRVDGNDDGRG
ncbi:MAG: hypothetical protein IRZ07_02555 [Microbispora sp.]|nr:hypothetical protein [Microbispora sp.]